MFERIFSVAGMVVLPCWVLIAAAPKWRWSQRLATFVAPLLIAAVYVWLLVGFPATEGGGFGSLEQVGVLFRAPNALLAGWIHYLAFDLFTGAWEARDAARLGISRWIVLPCLALTFLFGPLGLAVYLLVRLAMRRSVGAGLLKGVFRENRGIAVGVCWNVILLVGSLVAMPLDGRRILGLNPWVKPVKFDISVIVFLLTAGVMLWALGREWRRAQWWMGWGFGISMIVEDTVIALQAGRGVQSHMNYSSLLNGVLFGLMGLFIAVNTVMAVWLLVVWFAARTGYAPVVVWGVRLGLLMLLAASGEGFRMVAWGGHTVGAADGGPGLPFLNWSTGYGDLRVAHFFGLHGLQAFPLAGLGLTRTGWGARVQVALLFVGVGVYSAGLVVICGGDASGCLKRF